MSKPSIHHAGCGGRLVVAKFNYGDRIYCIRCCRAITDPSEMEPRGNDFKKEPKPLPESWDAIQR